MKKDLYKKNHSIWSFFQLQVVSKYYFDRVSKIVRNIREAVTSGVPQMEEENGTQANYKWLPSDKVTTQGLKGLVYPLEKNAVE